MSDQAIRDTVRAKYGEAALRALDSPHGGCRCDRFEGPWRDPHFGVLV